MGENFIKFKKKALAICWIKTAVIGLAVGMLFFGVFLLLSKFEVLAMQPILSLPIGIGAMLLSGGVAFLLLYRTDRALARKLDEQFALDERTQTMLAYGDKQGTLYDLQRKDADASLAAVPLENFKFTNLWVYIVSACIGVSSLTAGLVLAPEEEIVIPPPPEAFAITDIQVAAMEELIVYVENSAMQSPYKENVTTSLRDLLEGLKQATTVDVKDALLETAVEDINDETDDSSAAVELMNALWSTEAEGIKRLAETLNYYDWTKGEEWTNFTDELTEFRTSFMHADSVTENPDVALMATDTAALLLRTESGVTLSLTRAGVPNTDGLYVQLTRFASANESYDNGTHLYGCSTLSAQTETIGYEQAQKELDATFSVLGADIFHALEQHAANTSTGEYAMTRLAELFDCSLPKFERPNFYLTSTGEDLPDGEEGGGGMGGIGSGAVYGSDDLVLDPLTNTYVEYGTILDKYYGMMFSKVEGGSYTEQEKEAMEKYFDILYGGFDEEEGE